MDEVECQSECRGLVNLPAEVLEHILIQDDISAKDVVNVMQTSVTFRSICETNEIWRKKLRQRWPGLEDRYDRKNKYSWYEEYKQRNKFGKAVQGYVAGLSPKFYTKLEVSKEGFNDIAALITQRENAGEFVIDELMEIVHDQGSDQNLTMKYYAEKTLRFLQQTVLSENIKAFIDQPVERQRLERGAALLAQWCQPTENITVNEISDSLDHLAMEVKKEVCEAYPTHPLATTNVNLQDVESDLWSCEQCGLVLHTLNSVFYNRHKFSGNSQNYYQQTNSFIDKVLKTKTGIPITLCIIYLSIARRLGVVCEPVNFPMHFLIRWKQHPMLPKDQMYTYIDVFNGGKFLNESQLSGNLNVPVVREINAAEPVEVLSRMIRNLISIGRQQGRMGDNWLCLRNALELALIVSPDDFDLRLLLGRVNLHLNINMQDVIDSLQIVADHDQHRMELVAHLIMAAQAQMEANKEEEDSNKKKVKTRKKSKDALFSVGLIMKHKRYNYMCVIYGWDKKCEASEEWIIQMGVHNLPNKHKQPFYNVLVEDGSNRYAAEESLDFAEIAHPIAHPEVGKYFCSYKGYYYLPNAEKENEYPEDVQMTASLVRKQYS